METIRQVEGTIHSIYATIKTHTTVDPYPFDLTRTGIEWVVAGISHEEFTVYFNHNRQQTGKKKVVCYFDTSPSMNDFIPYMVYIADFFANCEECEMAGGLFKGRFAFSETVKGMNEEQWTEFITGKVRGGCGTSFDSIVHHLMDKIDANDVDIALVFTDGYSSITDDLVEKFNQSGKKCYNIYFTNPNCSYGYGHQRKGQETDQMEMTSDLDKLDGESFTIRCRPEEKK